MPTVLDNEELIVLGRAILNIFNEWELSQSQQRSLLGEAVSGKLFRLMISRGSFPEIPESLKRAEHLLAIHDCLRTAYPRSNMSAHWLNRGNRHFGNRKPIEIMLESGLEGMRQVRGHLDCTQNWID